MHRTDASPVGGGGRPDLPSGLRPALDGGGVHGVHVVDLAGRPAELLSERGHPDVRDVGGQLARRRCPRAAARGRRRPAAAPSGARRRRRPATHGPKTQARPTSCVPVAERRPPTTRPSSRATRTLDVQSGSTSSSSAATPSRSSPSIVVPRLRSACSVAIRSRTSSRASASTGGDRHASSSFSRSAADRLPGSAPVGGHPPGDVAQEVVDGGGYAVTAAEHRDLAVEVVGLDVAGPAPQALPRRAATAGSASTGCRAGRPGARVGPRRRPSRRRRPRAPARPRRGPAR